jgi:superfamily II DNA or RNA helicase
MSDRAIYSDVIKSWKRLAPGKKTITYCVNVRHAAETAEAFNRVGVSAAVIHGGTPTRERDAIMAAFRAGKITMLCNVGIVSEGVSINDEECCLLLRPTESLALYHQQAMRCMRYQPGKTAIIIDCVGNYTRNPMPDADIEWSLSQKTYKKNCTNDCGNFYVRVCKKCYKTFKTADKCPYCGAEYELEPREIKAHEAIELTRIKAEEIAAVEQRKAEMRREVQRARTFPELMKIARERGYSQKWVYMMMRARSRKE